MESHLASSVILVAADLQRRQAIGDILLGTGLQPRVAMTTTECLVLLQAEPIPLVVIDLPQDATAAAIDQSLREIRVGHPGVEIIALSGSPEGTRSAVEAGAFTCLPPFCAEGLLGHSCRQALVVTRLRDDHRRVQQQLATLEKEWERTFDTIPDAIAIIDREGRIVRGNRSLGEFFGLVKEDLLLQPMDDALSSLSLAARLKQALSTGCVVCHEESPPGQDRTYAATISPIASGRDDQPGGQVAPQPGAVLLLRDVTAERRLQRRLLLGERIAAVGQLAAGLAHEINNPMSFTLSNLQMAMELLDLHKAELPTALREVTEMLDECLIGVSRVRDIVRDLRTFTSTEVRSATGEVRLDDIIDLGLRFTRSEVQKRARLVYDRDLVPTPPIHGDAGKLSHVLLNLVSQALHNLPPAGDASAKSQHSITVRTRVDRRRNLVELVVADTGPMLSEEMRAHLFEPFAQRRERLPPRVSAAIGMGLAVSFEIVRRHGGEIRARPGAHGGNELIVLLPLLASGAAHDPTPVGFRGRILFIDDEPLLLRSYRRLIGDLHDVTTVASGREALELLSSGEYFDAIFCDLVMPVMDGVQLFRTIADRDASCAQRFVFLTGASFSPELVTFLGQNNNPHVDKPVGRDSLLQAITTLRTGNEMSLR